ncbi:MAG: hypothetical protein DRP63_06220 [Planctomycetota bacterium]|nr:MAG: hypothetical protein DRP63_06220 [Planctomycetota bacterium]
MKWAWFIVLVVMTVAVGKQPKLSPSPSSVPEAELRRELERGLESKDWQRVLEAVNRLLPIHPEDSFLWWAKGQALVSIARESNNTKLLQEAQVAFEKVIQLDESYLDAYIGKAVVLALLGQDELARIEMKGAVARGYPVREIQGNEVLVKFLLRDPPFFLELLEKERIFRINVKHDPFECPIKPKQPGRTSSKVVVPFHEQRALVVMVRRAKERLIAEIEEGDWEGAMEVYEQFRKLCENALKKLTISSLKKELMGVIADVEKRKAEIQRIKKDWLVKKAETLIKECEEAISRRKLKEATKLLTTLGEFFKKFSDSESPEILQLLRKYKDAVAVLTRRVAVLKEFEEKILPTLRLTGTLEEVVGEKVIRRVAFIEVAGQTEVVEVGQPVPRVPGLRLRKVVRGEDLVKLVYKGENVELKLSK